MGSGVRRCGPRSTKQGAISLRSGGDTDAPSHRRRRLSDGGFVGQPWREVRAQHTVLVGVHTEKRWEVGVDPDDADDCAIGWAEDRKVVDSAVRYTKPIAPGGEVFEPGSRESAQGEHVEAREIQCAGADFPVA